MIRFYLAFLIKKSNLISGVENSEKGDLMIIIGLLLFILIVLLCIGMPLFAGVVVIILAIVGIISWLSKPAERKPTGDTSDINSGGTGNC